MESTLPTVRVKALLDTPGVSLSAYVDPAHQAASLSSRDIGSWRPSAGSADADLLPELPILVPRTRDLVRNHGIAAGGVETIKDNVVGVGFRRASTPDYRALGKEKDWARDFGRNVESEWRSWAETDECDASRSMNFAGLTRQVMHSWLVNGEALAIMLWQPRPDAKWSTRLQMVESDRLGTPLNRLNDPKVRGGIEVDEYGAPVAYWVKKTHPGDYGNPDIYQEDYERIPARTEWGRRRIIHVHDKEREGQRRGKSVLVSILQQFKMFDHYTQAELKAAVVNALVCATIETPADSATLLAMFGGDADKADQVIATRSENRAQLKSGAIIPLNFGEKLSPFAPTRPAAAFDGFTTSVLRHIAVGLGIPYELLAKDWSKTNYSSGRAAVLEAWRNFNSRRAWLNFAWLQPCAELVDEEAVNAGRIDAADWYENRFAYGRSKWIGPGRGWVDPTKEAEATGLRMTIGITTLEMECAEQGLDYEEVIEQRAYERDLLKEAGLLVEKTALPSTPAQDVPQEDPADNATEEEAA